MGGLGEVCGAVTGVFMVLGLKFGSINGHDEDKKEIINRKAVDYIRLFQGPYTIDYRGVEVSGKIDFLALSVDVR